MASKNKWELPDDLKSSAQTLDLLFEALDHMQDFVDKVDRGEARSKRTYGAYKAFLEKFKEKYVCEQCAGNEFTLIYEGGIGFCSNCRSITRRVAVSSLVYYQPDLKHPNLVASLYEGDFSQYNVYHHKHNAEAAFPNTPINKYSGYDIVDLYFMDAL